MKVFPLLMPFTPGSSVLSAVARLSVVCLVFACRAPAREVASDPWQAALNFDYNVASDEFARRHAEVPADARMANAYAASLLVKQPRTADNVTLARTVLESVLARTSGGDQRALALYLLGRIDHEHVVPARLEEARGRYEQLRREQAGHPLADHAAVHLGLMKAFQFPATALAERIARVEWLLSAVTAPSARRELHYLLGHLHWRVGGDAAAALPHFLAGRGLGFETPYRNSEVDLMIAGLAAELGRDGLAAQHYRAFAAAQSRDARAQTARRLADEAAARQEARP